MIEIPPEEALYFHDQICSADRDGNPFPAVDRILGADQFLFVSIVLPESNFCQAQQVLRCTVFLYC